MSERKYANLVRPLPIGVKPGSDPPKLRVWIEHKDLEGISNFSFGGTCMKDTGVYHPWAGAHIHKCDEILFFLGLDPSDITYLGAEVAVELGEEQEEHIINESSIVVIPRDLPHGPFTTLRIDKPYYQFHILFSSQYQVAWMPKDSKPPKTVGLKYKHLIKPLRIKGVLKPRESGIGPGNADQLVRFSGKDLEDLPIHLSWGVYSQCGTWHREGGISKAHRHPFDEILIFIGLNPDDLTYLGAELEIDVGEEHERYVFSKPTLVICPNGLQHLPIVTRWVDKPFGCIVISLNHEYKTEWTN